MLGRGLEAGEKAHVKERRRLIWIVAGVVGLVGVAGIAGLIGATVADEDAPPVPTAESGGETSGQPRRFEPEGQASLAAPFPSDASAISCYPTASVRRGIVLRRRPRGARKAKLTRRTEWGSPRVLGVVRRRKGWLAVQAPELKNGDVGWIKASQAKVNCVQWSLHADLSRRRLVVRKDGKAVRKLPIAIGSPNHPTPKGRFSVTDKLKVTDRSSPYGCCVLALTGHQNKLPPDWPGGDRLAVHATTDAASIGKPVSLGCMRANPGQARWLIETVPLGSPIFIRS